MSFLNSLFVRDKKKHVPFVIYENAYLTSNQDSIAQQQYTAISMTGYYEFGFKNQVNIASEPLENSQFSSDSIQNTPYDIFIIGVVTQQIKNRSYTAQDVLKDAKVVEAAFEKYLNDTTLLAILPSAPLFKIYSSLHLVNYAYDFTPDKTNLLVYATFRQIRQTTTQFGGLSQSDITNPENSSVVDNGNVNPTTPSVDVNNLLSLNSLT